MKLPFQKDKHDKDPAGIICQTGDLATVVHLLEEYSTVYDTFVEEKELIAFLAIRVLVPIY